MSTEIIDPIKKISHIKDVTIVTLKINLNTNIPESKNIEVTSGILYQPDSVSETEKLSNYPFFTMDVMYNPIVLNNMSYSERKRFFFDKEYFVEVLTFMIRNPEFQSLAQDYVEEDYLEEDMTDDIYQTYEKL